MITAVLFVTGVCTGSFVNALVWRIHKQASVRTKKERNTFSITTGRSMCPDCRHTLSWRDLVPVLSWLFLRGKCRYCKKPISVQYPIVELSMAALFMISYEFWPRVISSWEVGVYAIWCICLAGLVALIVYDLRWMLLPNRIIFPLYGFAALYVIFRALSENSLLPVYGATVGVLVGGGIFYVLFQVSKGTWIGGGDVKLGFLLGALVDSGLSAFLLLFLASLLGTIVIAPLLLSRKVTRQSRIPFGPFLILAGFIVVLFGEAILQGYTDLFISIN